MLKGIDENGNIKNVRVSDKDSLFVKLVGSSGTDTSDATAVASDIKKGKTAYARGEKITGTYEGGSGGDMNVKMFTDISELSQFEEGYEWNEFCSLILELPYLDTGNIEDLSGLFSHCSRLNHIPQINVTNKCHAINNIFSYCKNIKEFDCSKLGWDTSSVTSFTQMFYGCSGATRISLKGLDFSSVDTENAWAFGELFCECTSLTEVDFGDMPNIEGVSLSCLFKNCTSLISIDLSMFNIPEIPNLDGLFYDCSNLETVNFGNINISNKIKIMDGMILNCPSLSKNTLKDILTLCTKVDTELYEGERVLKAIGFTHEQLELFTQEELQPVLDAGWTLDWE